MTTLPADPPVVVDRGGPAPLGGQISAQLQAAVAGGVLRAGDRLPSSRDLAATLGVSRTVGTNAYARLFAEAGLGARQGSGPSGAAVTPATLTSGTDLKAPNQGLGRKRGRGPAGADVQ